MLNLFKNITILYLILVFSTSCSGESLTPDEKLERHFIKYGADLKYQTDAMNLYISQKKLDKAFQIFVNTQFLSIKKDLTYNKEMQKFIFESIKELSKKEQLNTINQIIPIFTEITPFLIKRVEILAEGGISIDAWLELEKIYELDSNVKNIGKKILFHDLRNHLKKNSGTRFLTIMSKINSNESRDFMKNYLTQNPSNIMENLELSNTVFDEKTLLDNIKNQNFIQKKIWITQSLVQKANLDEIKKIFETSDLPLKFYIYYEYRRVLNVELGEDFLENLLKESSLMVKKAAFETVLDFKETKYLKNVLDEINNTQLNDENESFLILLFKILTVIDKNSGKNHIKLFESKIGEKKLEFDDYKLIREELKSQFSLPIDKDIVESLSKSENYFISERGRKLINQKSNDSEKPKVNETNTLKNIVLERKKLKTTSDFVNWYESVIYFLDSLK